MTTLLPIEKFIIESIANKPQNIGSLKNDTKLNQIEILKHLVRLKKEEFIIENDQQFFLNPLKRNEINESLRNRRTLIFDLKKIAEKFTRIFDKKNEELLTIKKVHLSHDEYLTVQSLMKQIDLYLNERKTRKKVGPLYNKRVFYWGSQTYEEVYSRT